MTAIPLDPTETDVLVVGSGLAGCAAALSAARSGADVTMVTKATRPEGSSSWWAQGGIAVTRADPDSFRRDVVEASDGTADPDAVDVLVGEARAAVEDVLLETLEVPFDTPDPSDASDITASSPPEASSASDAAEPPSSGDTAATENYDYAREAAHSERRILHVEASTGQHILPPFLSHLDERDDIDIHEDTAALELITHEGRVHGALLEREGRVSPAYAGATILATGGVGSLYPRTTNPEGSTGDGIAMAALAGADTDDMEYVQFHPTVYDGEEPFLVSEAVRGEGAILRNADVERFMPDYHEDAELAPRDVVARAVRDERERTGGVTLDVSPLDFADEFPGLAAKCEDRGIDPAEGIPVSPAEHFLCGGIAVDDRGRASLDRLFAVGECARTGVHGANRLASTSLLECLVWGLRAGETAATSGVDPDSEGVEPPDLLDSDPDLPPNFAAEKFTRLRRVMGESVGLERDPEELARAQGVLRRLKGEVDAYVRTRTSRSLYELRAAAVTALLITRAAAENPESKGCHYVIADSGAHAG